MQYHDTINTVSVDSQTIGILVIIPVTGTEEQPIIATYKKCEKCKIESRQYENFCSHCGGKIIEVTEQPKNQVQEIPLPDVRNEMKELGIEIHSPFREDFGDGDGADWVFVIKGYTTLGHRSDFEPFIKELDIQQIQNDLIIAKDKFKDIITKYNGKVVFGIVGEHTDW
jgi:hypothetical protein